MSRARALAVPAIVAAATVGDGIFALPYVFYQSGWLVSLFYLAAVAAIVATAHMVYLQTLEKVGEKERLLGLARRYFGRSGFWTGFAAIVAGLLLTLVAYVILGAQFIRLAAPALAPSTAFFLFWVLISLTVLATDRRIVELELIGIACTSVVIIFIFASAWPNVVFAGIPAITAQNLFLPFGVIVFALAGWTSVEPVYEFRKRSGLVGREWSSLASGSLLVIVLYLLFTSGILGSAPSIASDTVSGLAGWPLWKKDLIAAFGLIAIATIYLPISREIKNALEKDLRWSKFASRSLIIFLPLALIALGLHSFLAVVGLTGGVFIGVQYLLIVAVGRRALAPSRAKRFVLDLIAFVFIVAAVYELWLFIVH